MLLLKRFSRRQRRVAACVLTVLLLTVAVVWWRSRRPPLHPHFGEVRQAHMNGAVYRSGFHRWLGTKLPLPRWLLCDPQYLRLGTNDLWWTENDLQLQTGWLIFWDPTTTNAAWEFSRTRRSALAEVDHTDLLTSFSGHADPIGRAMFGSDWATNAVRVHEGQVLLARRVGAPLRIYALQLGQRSGPWGESRMRVEYVTADLHAPPAEK